MLGYVGFLLLSAAIQQEQHKNWSREQESHIPEVCDEEYEKQHKEEEGAHLILFIIILPFFKKIFYLFIHDRHRKNERKAGRAETQAEGEAGSMQGA